MNFSIIIAAFRRSDELYELLQSLAKQTDSAFEIIIVDDGSPTPLKPVSENFKSQLKIQYLYKENSGPALSRNFGMKHANGDYFIFLDSDTIAPKNYIEMVRKELDADFVDAYGGPDAADESFSALQKAITFAMTSFLTTGGIRGGKKHVGKFQPRSFNMGLSKKAFEKTSGFASLRIGEDPDLSMTLWENGFETRLFSTAKVFHKRRTTLKKLVKQIYEFGVARPILNQRHPKYKKITFWFPSLFIIGFAVSIIFLIISLCVYKWWSSFFLIPILCYLAYFIIILVAATSKYKSIKVGFLSIRTTLIQFFCYGYGFLKSWIMLNFLEMRAEDAFPGHFSKENKSKIP